MSQSDLKTYRRVLSTFKGRRCFATFATNSVKLFIETNVKGSPYIWIDPPWECFDGDARVTSSASCPRHDEPDYRARFDRWCGSMAFLKDAFFEDFEVSGEEGLALLFRGGHRLIVPIDSEPIDDDAPSWYEHWYANEGTQANQSPDPALASGTPPAGQESRLP
jgi:hypothetical protein